jgi:hypothetical protein
MFTFLIGDTLDLAYMTLVAGIAILLLSRSLGGGGGGNGGGHYGLGRGGLSISGRHELGEAVTMLMSRSARLEEQT